MRNALRFVFLGAAAAPMPAFSQTYPVSQYYVARQDTAPRQDFGPRQDYAPREMTIVQQQPRPQRDLGGGFIEFLFSERQSRVDIPPPVELQQPSGYVNASVAPTAPAYPQDMPLRPTIDPRYLPQEVEYETQEPVGTLVIDTPNRFLYLVEADGRAMRYGIGVGRPGFTWAGTHKVTSKKEWPDWHPPEEMLKRQPYLPTFMPGGPQNPLGARALYLGSTLYRIHGSNEPWTIGQMVSSGCIRMRNEDVTDLYGRVKVGTKVVVL
jgi:lipoprotein-anchoring transpeptidase ErfK/SrfK